MIFLSSVVNRCLDRLSSRFETGYLSADCAIGSSALLLPTLAARATARGGKVDGLVDGLDHRFHRPSGVGHWRACLGGRQIQDARVLQRAYVSALPGGISTTTRGELLAHVEFKNVGHLPASQLKSLLKFTAGDDGDWSPQPFDDKDLRPAGVLPIGISVTTGSYPIGVPQPWTKYLYAWGRVTYVDGFGNERWTNFCHRYNTEVKEAQIGGGNRIRKEYGRHHEYGNDAN